MWETLQATSRVSEFRCCRVSSMEQSWIQLAASDSAEVGHTPGVRTGHLRPPPFFVRYMFCINRSSLRKLEQQITKSNCESWSLLIDETSHYQHLCFFSNTELMNGRIIETLKYYIHMWETCLQNENPHNIVKGLRAFSHPKQYLHQPQQEIPMRLEVLLS